MQESNQYTEMHVIHLARDDTFFWSRKGVCRTAGTVTGEIFELFPRFSKEGSKEALFFTEVHNCHGSPCHNLTDSPEIP